MSIATIEADDKLMTADEFWALPTSRRPMELVRGRIVTMNVPEPRHGQLCGRADLIFGNFVDEHDLGHVLTNDTGIVTDHDPDEELTFPEILPGFAVPVRRFFE